VLFSLEDLTVCTRNIIYRCLHKISKYLLHAILRVDECKVKPKPLNPGQTVFYMVQPRFMNVDIRIMVDVTQGALDLFLSPRDDTFVVILNSTTGFQEVSY
jgi:hypothetical protein